MCTSKAARDMSAEDVNSTVTSEIGGDGSTYTFPYPTKLIFPCSSLTIFMIPPPPSIKEYAFVLTGSIIVECNSPTRL